MASTRRLTREERKAHTRARLMRSAAKVAAQRGLERASLDEVAEEAGFTKGAVYANFASKEALFLAMLDARFAERLEELDAILSTEQDPDTQAREAAAAFIAAIESEPEWERLFFEFTIYAARNEGFRRELVERHRMLRARVAELLERRARRLGMEPQVPPEQVATMTFAMANGIALERLLEPEAVPDGLYPEMMAIFFNGLRARAGTAQGPTGAPPPRARRS
ncbi:MAG TPA: TetR/AcrR family transcriptional regulator [Thermoleophilaceae bacterium]|nr:TetR/AcrR family transcriptional regulator [Thermoleophilaceae bacterium]